MFYDFALLSYHRKGKFSLPWAAATMRNNCKLITYNDVMTLDFGYLCDEILKYVMSNSSHKRLSLRLSAQLVYGLAILHRKKVLFIQDEIYASYSGAFINLVKPKTKRTPGAKRPHNNRSRNDGQQQTVEEAIPAILTIEEEVQNLLNYEISNINENELIELLNRESVARETSITLLEAPAAYDINMAFDGYGEFDQSDFGPQELTMENLFPVENPINECSIQEDKPLNTNTIPELPTITIQEPTPQEIVTVPSPIKRKRESDNSDIEPNYKKSRLDQIHQIDADVLNNEEINDFILSSLTSVSVPEEKRGIKRKKLYSIIDAESVIPNEIFISTLNNNKIYTQPLIYANKTKIIHNMSMFSIPTHQQLGFNLKTLFDWIPSRQKATIEESLQFFLENAKDVNHDLENQTQSTRNDSATIRQNSYLSETDEASLTPLLPEISLRVTDLHPSRNISESTEAPANNSILPSTSNEFIQPEIANDDFEEQLHINIPSEDEFSFSAPVNISPLSHNSAAITHQLIEAKKTSEHEISQSSFNLKKIKRFYFNKIKDMWLRGIREFEFVTLCPPETTIKKNAAIAFSLLLRLVKMKSLQITTKADSLEIYKIIILKD